MTAHRTILAALALVASASASARAPNVVFILADDLGYGEVGCYGQSKIRTPNLDRMAAEGLRFTRHYSGNAVCAPSRCVLMTGRHPGRAFIRDNRSVGKGLEGQFDIPADAVTVAELLKARGFATGAYGKWGLGTVGGTGDPLSQGFDHFFGYVCQAHAHSLYPAYLRDDGREFPLKNVPPIPGHAKLPPDADPNDPGAYAAFKGTDYAPDRIHEKALAFLRANKDRPFFFYYPNIIPHVALMVPDAEVKAYEGKLGDDPPYVGGKGYTPHRTPHAAYAAYITHLDTQVGEVLATLRELGLEKDTLVVFSSDNGPTHDVGGVDTGFFKSAGGLRGLKGSLYEGGIRVPCIARWPGRIEAGRTSDFISGFEDWMPTFLDVAGAAKDVPAVADGVSLLPTLLGETQPARPFLYREFAGYGGQQAVWQGPWKAIRQNLQPKGKKASKAPPPVVTELYNLEADPAEAADVAAKNPDVLARFEGIMKSARTVSPEFPIVALDGVSAAK